MNLTPGAWNFLSVYADRTSSQTRTFFTFDHGADGFVGGSFVVHVLAVIDSVISGVPPETDDFPHDRRRPHSFSFSSSTTPSLSTKHRVATGSVLVRSLAGSDEYVDIEVMPWPGFVVFFGVDGERGSQQRLDVLCEAHG